MLGREPFPIGPGVGGEAVGTREGELGAGVEAQKGSGHRLGRRFWEGRGSE